MEIKADEITEHFNSINESGERIRKLTGLPELIPSEYARALIYYAEGVEYICKKFNIDIIRDI
jgi:hypothetical protein